MHLSQPYQTEKAFVERMYANSLGHPVVILTTRQLADDLYFDIVQAPPNQPGAYLRVHDGSSFYVFPALLRG